MAVTLVVVWDSDLQEPLAVKRVANMRHAREEASELEKEYTWSPRISFYEEVDFLATEAGMSEQEKTRAMQQIRKDERPEMYLCPHCGQHHPIGAADWFCPLDPNKPLPPGYHFADGETWFDTTDL